MSHPNDHTLAIVLDDRDPIVRRSVPEAEINYHLAGKIDDDDNSNDELMISRQGNGGGLLQNVPSKSFLVSLSEYTLLKGNAFINRKKSYRGNVGPSSAAKPNPIVRQLPRIGKSKVSLMISLPQSQNLVDAKTPRLFQKPRESVKEPKSPEVSCTGRVRSKHDDGRHLQKRPGKKLSWLLSRVRAVFGGKPRPPAEAEIIQRSSSGGRLQDRNVDETFPNSRSVEPAAGRNHGVMERFTSRRRLELLH